MTDSFDVFHSACYMYSVIFKIIVKIRYSKPFKNSSVKKFCCLLKIGTHVSIYIDTWKKNDQSIQFNIMSKIDFILQKIFREISFESVCVSHFTLYFNIIIFII